MTMGAGRVSRTVRGILGACALLALAAGGCGGGGSDGPTVDDLVLSPEKAHFGATYGEWSARWWQWAVEQPRPTNPVMDLTGEHAHRGQVDPVWFLAGTFGGDAERTVTIPSGRPIFFPVVNNIYDNTNCDQPDLTFSFTELRDMLAEGMLNYADLYCVLDGVVLLQSPDFDGAVRWRAQAPEFSAYMPDDNFWGNYCGVVQPAEFVAPIASDGIWIMLKPLPVGPHELYFEGRIKSTTPGTPDFWLKITYHITIAP